MAYSVSLENMAVALGKQKYDLFKRFTQLDYPLHSMPFILLVMLFFDSIQEIIYVNQG